LGLNDEDEDEDDAGCLVSSLSTPSPAFSPLSNSFFTAFTSFLSCLSEASFIASSSATSLSISSSHSSIIADAVFGLGISLRPRGISASREIEVGGGIIMFTVFDSSGVNMFRPAAEEGLKSKPLPVEEEEEEEEGGGGTCRGCLGVVPLEPLEAVEAREELCNISLS
jgi:hypothetical protein